MARSAGQKLKLLYLKDMLLKHSDENHPLTINEMIARLAELGISAERKSIYDDFETLRLYGLDIIRTKRRTTGYYVAEREFELPELKLLVDAVQSSRFITHAKTAALINKIEGLASVHEGRYLQRQVYVQNRVKAMNESVYYNVDAISEAIERRLEITFKYFDYGPDKQRRYRHGGEKYTVSPEFLVWDDENYYMVACPEGTLAPRHYRVDKMSSIELTDTEATPSGADPARYTNALFGMYGGETRRVSIRFSNDLASVAIDRFGKDVIFVPQENESFSVTVEVAVSPQFLAWIFALGSKAEIISPADVRETMRAHLASCLGVYGK